ncbi:MAG: hypothetical protein RLZZ430_1955 [Cyanobacteriota bacterium]|jgi:hypothetical protein
MLYEAQASFLHPLSVVEPSDDPEVLLFNAFALGEEMVVAALSPERPDANFRVVRILFETGLPTNHIQEMFAETRSGNKQALLRLIEYVADALVDESDAREIETAN